MNQSDPYALPEDEIEKSFFTHKWKVVVAVGIFLIAIVYLGFNAFQGASSYYLTVGELVDKGPAIYDKNVRVNGSLIPASFKRIQPMPSCTLNVVILTPLSEKYKLPSVKTPSTSKKIVVI